MAKWSDSIAAQEAALDLLAALTQAQDNWSEVLKLRNEVLKLREVNTAQADNFASIAGQLSDREHQLRQAQERIRAAEMQRDRAWNDAIEAATVAVERRIEARINWGVCVSLPHAIRALAKTEAGQ